MTSALRVIPIEWEAIERGVFLDYALNRSPYIYHLLPWPHAKTIFENKRLRLSSVKSWNDPYEQWWCDRLFGADNQPATNAYGICWTTNSLDEPHWRMAAFGKDDPIVRIRCGIRAVLRAGTNLATNANGKLYLGKIRCCNTDRLEKLASGVSDQGEKAEKHAAAGLLLCKRNAFRFEHEVRLLWLDDGGPANEFFIEIDPARAISQVMTSPYAKWEEHVGIKRYVEGLDIESRKSAVMRAPDK